jgi:ADP-heptose:LPS heptosyltransferase/glycosyltransferase involved in cell wall biosynthesis
LKFKDTVPNREYHGQMRPKTAGQRHIIFSHGRALGDCIMFTAGVRDFKLLFPDIAINVQGPFKEIWENNPRIDLSVENVAEHYRIGYPAIGSCNGTYIHFTHMFLLDMIAAADAYRSLPISLGEFCSTFANGDVGDPSMSDPDKNSDSREPYISWRKKYAKFCKEFSRQRGEIFLSENEKKHNLILEEFGINHYWVVCPGGKTDGTAKIWDWRRMQDVIDYFDKKIKFVTIGKSGDITHKLNNVIDLYGRFDKDLRGLFGLIYHSAGCLTGASMLVHLAAAVPKKEDINKPCVLILGGREPTGWTAYTGNQVLHTNGALDCCKTGGCWKSRTIPLNDNAKKSYCYHPVECEGKTIQSCMDMITADDVIRAIERYYPCIDEGNIREYDRLAKIETISCLENKKINLMGNLHTPGGGEQSLCMIAKILIDEGWEVKLYPFSGVHEKFSNNGLPIMDSSFKNGMAENMEQGLPLLFYANDSTRWFAEKGRAIVDKSSAVIIGINYVNRPIPTCKWLADSGKLRAVVFQNGEKLAEFDRDRIGFDDTKLIRLFGAIDLKPFLHLPIKERKDNDTLIILKHCRDDYRKYVTKESENKGDKIHVWQKNLSKDRDVKFYKRLLHKLGDNIRFEFMEAHKELREAFRDDNRMVFHGWDSISITDFLSRGHVYLYRTSNMWRDQYPRTVAEALASGLPILSEPRDGTYDRIVHGNTGFYCIDFDAYAWALKLLKRKEKYRQAMGQEAKKWAEKNLDPRRWASVIEEALS